MEICGGGGGGGTRREHPPLPPPPKGKNKKTPLFTSGCGVFVIRTKGPRNEA